MVHAFGGFPGDFRPLEIHPVLFDEIDFYRLERAEAHVQGHACEVHSLRFDLREQVGSEVQPGRRRRDRTGAIGEHGLVVDRILGVRDAERAPDVGWQGSGPEGGEIVEEKRRFAPVLRETENVEAGFGASRFAGFLRR